MATISSKILKNYDKKLLKPFVLSVFRKSEKIKNALEFPDFGINEKYEEDGKAEKKTETKEEIKEKSKSEDKLDNKKGVSENVNNAFLNDDNIDSRVDFDKEFLELEDKLKNEELTSKEEADKKDKDDENSDSRKLIKDSSGDDKTDKTLDNSIEEKNVSDNEVDEIVPMIEESRHLEILEAERNKYKKLGYKEGYDKALLEAKDRFLKEYEVKKNDYLEILASSFSDAIGEIKKIRDILLDLDKNLPKIVLNLVRRIVGLERKINDKIIVSVVKSKIEKLKSLEDICFYVNPDDLEYLKFEFPGYKIEPDTNVIKGSFRVKTRIGEVIFDLDRMMDDLEETIYEELKVTESD